LKGQIAQKMRYFIAFVSLYALILCCPCNSQRIATSLGTKTKKLENSDQLAYNSKTNDDSDLKERDGVLVGTIGSLDIGFSDIYMEITTQRKSIPSKRVILDGSIKGRAKPGRMVAIMGPSGAGKSTVLHALAGRIKESPKVYLEGKRYVNGKRLSGDSILPIAFVEQEANFFCSHDGP